MKKFLLMLVLMGSVVTTAFAENVQKPIDYEYAYLYPCDNGKIIIHYTSYEMTMEELDLWYSLAEMRCNH